MKRILLVSLVGALLSANLFGQNFAQFRAAYKAKKGNAELVRIFKAMTNANDKHSARTLVKNIDTLAAQADAAAAQAKVERQPQVAVAAIRRAAQQAAAPMAPRPPSDEGLFEQQGGMAGFEDVPLVHPVVVAPAAPAAAEEKTSKEKEQDEKQFTQAALELHNKFAKNPNLTAADVEADVNELAGRYPKFITEDSFKGFTQTINDKKDKEKAASEKLKAIQQRKLEEQRQAAVEKEKAQEAERARAKVKQQEAVPAAAVLLASTPVTAANAQAIYESLSEVAANLGGLANDAQRTQAQALIPFLKGDEKDTAQAWLQN